MHQVLKSPSDAYNKGVWLIRESVESFGKDAVKIKEKFNHYESLWNGVLVWEL